MFSAEDAQDLQVKTLQAEIALMQQDLSSLKAKDEKLEKQIQSNAIELQALGIGGEGAIDLENPSQELEEGES